MPLTPDEMLKIAKETLDRNIEILNNGGNVDMSSFEENARALCTALAALPPLEAKKYEHTLKQLIDYLSQMRDDLMVKKDGLEGQITAINHRNKAYNAYGNAMFVALQTAQNED